MNEQQFNQNIEYLNDCDVKVSQEPLWDDYTYSRELYFYSPSGGDMCLCVEELSKEGVLKALDNFDINEEVSVWSGNLCKTPFNNIKELYEDIEEWYKEMKMIGCNMPN